jgi:transglutaminase-like putative cysteine protease
MHIRIGYELVFEVPVPTAILLALYVHPSRQKDLLWPEQIVVEPNVPISDFYDNFGNKVARVLAPAGQLRITHQNVIRDTGELDVVGWTAEQHNVQDLPAEVLQYLLNSRYCEVDELTDLAWNLFGQTPLGWPRVQAVLNWVHGHVTFGYEFARSTKTAKDVYEEKKGVCRDFMHLAVTLIRALNIPARYVTGYLGDIAIPYSPAPMDFSAWFEVYMGGRWWTCDARHNKQRVGRILMATGRDATDVALTTSFGPTKLTKFVVVTDEIPSPTSPPSAVAAG